MNKYEWTEERQPNDTIRYNYMTLTTPLGVFSLECKGWKESDSVCVYLDQEYEDSFNTIEEAKVYVDWFLHNKLKSPHRVFSMNV